MPFGEYGFAEDLNQIKTRLGRDDYMVFLPKGFDGPFGEKVTQLKINEWQINRIPENTEIDMESIRSEEHTSELQSRGHLVCRLLLEKNKNKYNEKNREHK